MPSFRVETPQRSYDAIVERGWDPRRVVLGTVASREHGAGFVPPEVLARTLRRHVDLYGDRFGGLMGWEYWHAGSDFGWEPWRWVATMGEAMRRIPAGAWLGDRDAWNGSQSPEENVRTWL